MKTGRVCLGLFFLCVLGCVSKQVASDDARCTASAGASCAAIFDSPRKQLDTLYAERQYERLPAVQSDRADVNIVLDNLAPSSRHELEIYRVSAALGDKVLSGKVHIDSDAKGRLDFAKLGRNGSMKALLRQAFKDPRYAFTGQKYDDAFIESFLKRRESLIRKYPLLLYMKMMNEIALKEAPDADLPKLVQLVKDGSLSDQLIVVVKDSQGRPVRRAALELFAQDQKVTRTELKDVTGTYAGKQYPLDGYVLRPAGRGPFPTVILVGGSGSSIPHGFAQYLASNGVAVVAMRYFSYKADDPGVQAGAINFQMNRMPLDRFAAAVEYAKTLDFVDSKSLFMMGESMGGTAVLLMAQHFGNELGLKGLIAMRPLHYSVGAKINGPAWKRNEDLPMWTQRGQDIPFVPLAGDLQQIPRAVALAKADAKRQGLPMDFEIREGVRVTRGYLTPFFNELLAHNHGVVPIQTAGFQGRLAVITGAKDGEWPSHDAARFIQRQRGNRRGDMTMLYEEAPHYVNPQRASVIATDEFTFMLRDYSVSLADAVSQDNAFVIIDGGHPVGSAFQDVQAPQDLLRFILAR